MLRSRLWGLGTIVGTRVVGAFPDGQSALMLAAARLRHVAGTKWRARRYLTKDELYKADLEVAEIA